MLKKCIFAIAVVVLLAASVQAASYKKDGRWPSTYLEVDICTIPVYMEIGYYVELDCEDKEIKLVQITCPEGKAFPCYLGCVELTGRANFPAIFGASLENKHAVLNETSVSFSTESPYVGNQFAGTGEDEKMQICVEAWDTNIHLSGSPNDKMLVADLKITVKPPDDPP